MRLLQLAVFLHQRCSDGAAGGGGGGPGSGIRASRAATAGQPQGSLAARLERRHAPGTPAPALDAGDAPGPPADVSTGPEYYRHTGSRARYTFFAQKARQHQCDRQNGTPVMRGDTAPPRGALAKDADFIWRQAPSVTFFLARQCVWCATEQLSASRSNTCGSGGGRARRTRLADLGPTQANEDGLPSGRVPFRTSGAYRHLVFDPPRVYSSTQAIAIREVQRPLGRIQ